MRVTDLYELKNNDAKKKKIMESLIEDIISEAEGKYEHDEFHKFRIKIKIVPLEQYL